MQANNYVKMLLFEVFLGHLVFLPHGMLQDAGHWLRDIVSRYIMTE